MTAHDAEELLETVWTLVDLITDKDAEIARLQQIIRDLTHADGCAKGVQRQAVASEGLRR